MESDSENLDFVHTHVVDVAKLKSRVRGQRSVIATEYRHPHAVKMKVNLTEYNNLTRYRTSGHQNPPPSGEMTAKYTGYSKRAGKPAGKPVACSFDADNQMQPDRQAPIDQYTNPSLLPLLSLSFPF